VAWPESHDGCDTQHVVTLCRGATSNPMTQGQFGLEACSGIKEEA